MAGVLTRRWYIVLVGMLLTSVGGAQAARPPSRYLGSAVVVLQSPVSPDTPNPLTGLYPSVAITGAAVADRMRSPRAKAEFRAAGVAGPYEFLPRNTGTNQEPHYVIASMTITSIAGDEESALRALTVLTAAFDRELTALQDRWNVAPHLRITVATLVPPSAVLLSHSASRAVLGAGLLGAITTAAITLWSDEILRRRKQRAELLPDRRLTRSGEATSAGPRAPWDVGRP